MVSDCLLSGRGTVLSTEILPIGQLGASVKNIRFGLLLEVYLVQPLLLLFELPLESFLVSYLENQLDLLN